MNNLFDYLELNGFTLSREDLDAKMIDNADDIIAFLQNSSRDNSREDRD